MKSSSSIFLEKIIFILIYITINIHNSSAIHKEIFCNEVEIEFTDVENITICSVNSFPQIDDNEIIIDINANNIQGLQMDDQEVFNLPKFNKIVSLKFLMLWVTRSHLKTISANDLKNFTNLEDLNLTRNEILYLEANLIANNLKLRKLDVSFNKIMYIHSTVVESFAILRYLNLMNNTCVNWDFVNEHSISNKIKNKTLECLNDCFFVENHANKKITELELKNKEILQNIFKIRSSNSELSEQLHAFKVVNSIIIGFIVLLFLLMLICRMIPFIREVLDDCNSQKSDNDNLFILEEASSHHYHSTANHNGIRNAGMAVDVERQNQSKLKNNENFIPPALAKFEMSEIINSVNQQDPDYETIGDLKSSSVNRSKDDTDDDAEVQLRSDKCINLHNIQRLTIIEDIDETGGKNYEFEEKDLDFKNNSSPESAQSDEVRMRIDELYTAIGRESLSSQKNKQKNTFGIDTGELYAESNTIATTQSPKNKASDVEFEEIPHSMQFDNDMTLPTYWREKSLHYQSNTPDLYEVPYDLNVDRPEFNATTEKADNVEQDLQESPQIEQSLNDFYEIPIELLKNSSKPNVDIKDENVKKLSELQDHADNILQNPKKILQIPKPSNQNLSSPIEIPQKSPNTQAYNSSKPPPSPTKKSKIPTRKLPISTDYKPVDSILSPTSPYSASISQKALFSPNFQKTVNRFCFMSPDQENYGRSFSFPINQNSQSDVETPVDPHYVEPQSLFRMESIKEVENIEVPEAVAPIPDEKINKSKEVDDEVFE